MADRKHPGKTGIWKRRDFIKLGMGAGGALILPPWIPRSALAQIAGGSLDPLDIPKYRTPLLIPPAMPRAGKIPQAGGPNIDYYEISVREFDQQILPDSFPVTTVWGYGAVSSKSANGLLLHNAPSLTIEAHQHQPVRIKWINELVDEEGNYLPHLLPVDPTLHWANPAGGESERDMRPEFSSTPGPYTGPVPTVPHVHGAISVGDESDGYAEAWFLPDANDIPPGYADRGTWYDFFAAKAADRFEVEWGPGYAVYQYPNLGRAATRWYHDHTLGLTRLNVYAGPAGFYLARGGPHGDQEVRDSRTGAMAKLPRPSPKPNEPFPPHRKYYEIPIAIQDRSFNSDGSLFYPDTREFFDGITGPYLPETEISPIWQPEFFGNCMMINGNTWPFLEVEQRRYRFRLLNGCQARTLILDFSGIPGVEVWQIGNEAGFLAEPVNLTADNDNQVLMTLAERADLIVDFAGVATGNYVLGNLGPDEPYAGGTLGVDYDAADPDSTGQVMQFRVIPTVSTDSTTPPQYLLLPPADELPEATVVRHLLLAEDESETFPGSPVRALLGTVEGDPNLGPATWVERTWMEEETETPELGATEIWEIYNTTMDAHPIHLHTVMFKMLNRQDILIYDETHQVQVAPGSEPVPPEAWETGVKETFIAYPGQVTRFQVQFNVAGQFVWHCHIVEHEDNEMMRAFRVGPKQPGQPDRT